MRRLLPFLLLLLAPALADEKPLRVCATTPDLAALAREVGGAHVAVKSFARGREDPHFVEAKPSHIRALNRADLLLLVGLDLEVGWLPVLVANARNRGVLKGRPGHVDVSTVIDVKGVPRGPVDRSMGDVHAYGNPHYLLDPNNAKRAAERIRDALVRLRPSAKKTFAERSADFARRVDERLSQWRKALAPYRGREVVTDHKAWRYFLERFGLVSAGALEPKPGVQPTTRHLLELVRSMRARKVRTILTVPYFDRRYADFVAENTGARVVVLAHQTGALPGADDYLKTIDVNVRRLAEAMKE